MKIQFSRSEFRSLLDMAFVACWVANSEYADPESESSDQFDIVRQKLYAFAEAYGFEGLVETDPETGDYVEAPKLLHSVEDRRILLDFEEECFWRGLASRFALRLLDRRLGKEQVDAMSPEERAEALEPLSEAFLRHFEEVGFDALQLESWPEDLDEIG